MDLIWALAATTLVSLISLVGIIPLALNEAFFKKTLLIMIGFAAGSLIGAAFLHLLPEALERLTADAVFGSALAGFVFFFVSERYFYWRHCHDGVCEVHAFTYLNIVGDGIHNLVDGMVIAAAFTVDFKVGAVATLAIIFHEVPQELGDFSILIYGGFSRGKALFYNFLGASAAIAGAFIGYALTDMIGNFVPFLLSFTAGGFIYIAAGDLLPELHKQKDIKRANLSLAAFFIGIIFMWVMSMVTESFHGH